MAIGGMNGIVGVGRGSTVAPGVGPAIASVGVGVRGESSVACGVGVLTPTVGVGAAVGTSSAPGDVHAANSAVAPRTTVAIRSMRPSLDSNAHKSTD